VHLPQAVFTLLILSSILSLAALSTYSLEMPGNAYAGCLFYDISNSRNNTSDCTSFQTRNPGIDSNSEARISLSSSLTPSAQWQNITMVGLASASIIATGVVVVGHLTYSSTRRKG